MMDWGGSVDLERNSIGRACNLLLGYHSVAYLCLTELNTENMNLWHTDQADRNCRDLTGRAVSYASIAIPPPRLMCATRC